MGTAEGHSPSVYRLALRHHPGAMGRGEECVCEVKSIYHVFMTLVFLFSAEEGSPAAFLSSHLVGVVFGACNILTLLLFPLSGVLV